MMHTTQKSYAAMRGNEDGNDLTEEAIRVRNTLKNFKHPKKEINILLLGLPGTGKSSLINSMFMAINKDGYREFARKGPSVPYSMETHTLELRGYSPFQYYNKGDEEYSYLCHPKIWDFAGLRNQDESELIYLLLNGRIKEGSTTEYIHLDETWWQHILKRFVKPQIWYWTTKTDQAIDIAIVVHAADATPPSQLLESIEKAAYRMKPRCRDISVFLVITKIDKVEKNQERLEFIKEQLSQYLKMYQVRERIFCMKLYADETADFNNKKRKYVRKRELDEALCILWDSILSPEYSQKSI